MKNIYQVRMGNDGKTAVLKGKVVYENKDYLVFVMDGATDVRTLNKKCYNINDLTTEAGKAALYNCLTRGSFGYFNMNPYDFSDEDLKISMNQVRILKLREDLKDYTRIFESEQKKISSTQQRIDIINSELKELEGSPHEQLP